MARCFVKVGQAPQADESFVRYTSHGGGSLLKVLLPAGSPEADTGTLASSNPSGGGGMLSHAQIQSQKVMGKTLKKRATLRVVGAAIVCEHQ